MCSSESNAILYHLAQGSRFLPDDPFLRAKVLQWFSFEADYVQSSMGSLRYWTLTGKLNRRSPGNSLNRSARRRSRLSVCSTGYSRRPTSSWDNATALPTFLYLHTHMSHAMPSYHSMTFPTSFAGSSEFAPSPDSSPLCIPIRLTRIRPRTALGSGAARAFTLARRRRPACRRGPRPVVARAARAPGARSLRSLLPVSASRRASTFHEASSMASASQLTARSRAWIASTSIDPPRATRLRTVIGARRPPAVMRN